MQLHFSGEPFRPRIQVRALRPRLGPPTQFRHSPARLSRLQVGILGRTAPAKGGGDSGGRSRVTRMAECHIFQQDCLEGIRDHVVPGSVDVIVTSPPYNLGKKYREAQTTPSPNQSIWTGWGGSHRVSILHSRLRDRSSSTWVVSLPIRSGRSVSSNGSHPLLFFKTRSFGSSRL